MSKRNNSYTQPHPHQQQATKSGEESNSPDNKLQLSNNLFIQQSLTHTYHPCPKRNHLGQLQLQRKRLLDSGWELLRNQKKKDKRRRRRREKRSGTMESLNHLKKVMLMLTDLYTYIQLFIIFSFFDNYIKYCWLVIIKYSAA
jgi:hypothetical protein